MLLSDARVANILNSEFVFAWESVRPVPRVTIDFGDRVLTRTLKGNTVMYACLPDGTVVDAFPGLYTPDDFLAEFQDTRALLHGLRNLSPDQQGEAIRRFHQNRPLAGSPGLVNVGKAAVESPLLRALEVPAPPAQPPPGSGPAAFIAYAAGITDLSESPMPAEAVNPDPLALDSSLSRTRLRPGVHLLLASLDRPQPDDCRDPLFKQLLKIPLDDPYLGLGKAVLPGTP
ncbi:MAG: hypothetical protein AB1758_13060 [Candidatus Eremiobacterota bacterium]